MITFYRLYKQRLDRRLKNLGECPVYEKYSLKGIMLVFRWQAPIVPNQSQIEALYKAEGLVPIEELFNPEFQINDHRHPFDEVRTVVKGELVFDVAGNKLLLRAGDKIVIPANTKHSFKAQGTEPCLCLYASKTW